MRHDWEPNDQQNWEMNCEAERAAKVRPLRDYNGDILNTGDLVWLTDYRPMRLAIVLGESHKLVNQQRGEKKMNLETLIYQVIVLCIVSSGSTMALGYFLSK